MHQYVVSAASGTQIHDFKCDATRFHCSAQRTLGPCVGVGANEHDCRVQRQSGFECDQIEIGGAAHWPVGDQARGADQARRAQHLTGDVDFIGRVTPHGENLRISVEYQAHARYDTTVPRLILVLPDLYPMRLARESQATLPRLPALERWLARGVTERDAGDWRGWLQRHFAVGDARALPLASIAGVAVAGVPTDRPLWLATPVHFVAGLDTLRVHPAGLLTLSNDEQQDLARDFARVFAGSDWSLHATGRRELIIAGGASGGVSCSNPAQWLGTDPAAGLPRGEGAAPLRRLGAELEMWLYEHPINQARTGRAALNASALWLWGGGAQVAAAQASVTDEWSAWADDLFVDGLTTLTGAAMNPRSLQWISSRQWNSASRASGDTLVVGELGNDLSAEALAALDRDWISPALEQWRRGAFGGVYDRATLLVGTRAVTLTRATLRAVWRRLRRPQPWWETLLQC